MSAFDVSHDLSFTVVGGDFAAVEKAIAQQVMDYTGWGPRRDVERIAEALRDAKVTVRPLIVTGAGHVELWEADVQVTV